LTSGLVSYQWPSTTNTTTVRQCISIYYKQTRDPADYLFRRASLASHLQIRLEVAFLPHQHTAASFQLHGMTIHSTRLFITKMADHYDNHTL